MKNTHPKKLLNWISRRDFLSYGLLATAFSLFGRGKNIFSSQASAASTSKSLISTAESEKAASPIQEISTIFRQKSFSGDNPSRAHSVLWKLDEAMAGIAIDAIEKQDVVIVGGGLSALLAAHEIKTKKMVILEQAPQFGGNAKAESWHGTRFAIGSSYVAEPEEDSRISRIFNEIGIGRAGRKKDETVADPVWYNNQIHPRFWSFEKDPKLAPLYAQVKKYFLDYLNNENGKIYPNFPPESDADRVNTKKIDQRSFMEELKLAVGNQAVPEPLQNAIEHYAWSSMGASAKEVSAAAAINFYAAELGEIRVFAGGNAAVAEALYKKLLKRLPKSSLRAQALVARVKKSSDGKYSVFYFDENQKLKQIDAERVVFACPKFIVQKIFPELDKQRAKVFSEIEYSSYLVANILLKQKSRTQKFYDLYRLDEANGNFVLHGKGDTANEAIQQKTTDLIWSTWATDKARESSHSILSLFRAIPHIHGRADLLAEDAFSRYQAEFQKEADEKILPMLKISSKNVEDIRVTRWGHPLPIAKKGLYSDDRLEKACKPIDGRIFFANQDNWALPAFENAAAAAFAAADEINKQA